MGMDACMLCPRMCGVDRESGEKGYCGMDGKLRAARAALHMWEEPCISGTRGSGAVFFSGCSLRCIFCQNYEIAQGNCAREISGDRLSEIFLELQEQGAANINLVTATHFAPAVIGALKKAKAQGMYLPVIYNSSGYERVETVQMFEEVVDVWLPDFKYMDPELAFACSKAKDYPEVAVAAIREMMLAGGRCEYDDNGYIQKGVIVRHLILPGGLFEELGIRYIGPIDGHSIPDLLYHLRHLESQQAGPVLLHVTTEKGRGYEHARQNPARYHGVPGFCKATGAIASSGKPSFSSVFGEAAVELAARHPEIHAITAAMKDGTGLTPFAEAHWDRFHDVGIAEEHAVTYAAGLAIGGLRPICAIYATFMQRALDCVYHDVVLPQLPVIFTLDRAGAVEDGPTHHGIYDLGFLRALPGLTVMAPRSGAELRRMLEFAYELKRPVAIRYPRGGSNVPPGACVPKLQFGRADVVKTGAGPVIWAMGPEVDTALAAAELLNMDCCVVNARFLSPFDAELARKLAEGRTTISIEDHVLSGGLGTALDEALSGTPHGGILHFGWPADRPVPHGKVGCLRREFGLTPEAIAETVRKTAAP